jgi:hypothetical protein
MTTVRGSCLCGAVRYTAQGDAAGFHLCHCSRCRKGSGSAHGANVFLSGGTLSWQAGEDRVRRYAVPGTRHARAFCTACGAPVPRTEGALLVIPAGSLDTSVPVRPTAHICTDSRADWDTALEALPKHPGLPDG